MSNANRNLQTDFSTGPYYDDFDATKKYQRILFRPSFPVQARELTQLQTILNEQIGRFGSSIYKDGSPVTGGSLSVTDVSYLKLANDLEWSSLNSLIIAKSLGSGYNVNDELLINNGSDQVIVRLGLSNTYSFSLINNVVPSGFFGKIPTENFNVTSGASGAQFEVNVKISLNTDPTDDREERPIFNVQGFTTKTSTDQPTLFGEYLTGTEFAEGDELYIYDEDNDAYGTSLGILGADFSGPTVLASVSPGTFYTNNFFVLIDDQTIPVDKYNETPSARIGFTIIEEIITERSDETLLDNAAGSPNENAPGAHRFKLRLALTAKSIDATETEFQQISNEAFYEIGRMIDGDILDRNSRPNYSVLGDEMAKRTYDINGNFVIDPFKITFDDKKLFSMSVSAHTTGSLFMTVFTTSVTQLETSDFTNKIFVVDERPYKIINATNPAESEINEFLIEIDSAPSFVNFQGESIDVFDQDYLTVSFAAGSAYVSGRRFNTSITVKKDFEKTRTPKHLKENITKTASTSFGNYLVLNEPITSLSTADFAVGSEVYLYSDSTAVTKIGTARVKQLKKGVNNTLELYFFDASFENTTATLNDPSGAASGQKEVIVTSASDGMLGATFTYAGTRYKIISRSSNTLTLNINLFATIPDGTELSLNYNAKTIKSVVVDPTSDAITLSVASSVQKDLDDDGYLETRVLRGDKTKLIFPISEYVASDLDNASYRYMKTVEVEFGGTNPAGTTIVPLRSDSTESLWPNTNEYFLQIVDTNSTLTAGDIVDPQYITITDIETGTIDITTLDSSYEGTALLSVPVQRTPSLPLSMSIVYGNTSSVSSALLSATDDSSYIDGANGHARIGKSRITAPNVNQSIGMSNIIKLRAIYEMDGSTGLDGTDVTDHYYIDYGQRDESVEHTKIALKPGRALPQNDLLVIVDRFTINDIPTGDATFLTMTSYDSLYYDILPKVQTSNDTVYDLRKTIDFRPRVSELSGTVNWESYSKTYNQKIFPPHASLTSTFNCVIDYYVGRKDKITITPDLEFKILQGKPNDNPEPPNHEDRSLTLYDITQASFSKDQDDIETYVYDNRSYTMNDISVIEDRLTRLEKTVQLDKIEKAILSQEVKDTNNTNLFKTGVFVDSFSNMNNSEVTNPDYKASVDTNEGELRPSFDQFAFTIDYDEDNVSSNAKITEDGVLFPQYDDTPVSFVTQSLATRTENVNPFAVMDWIGELKLKPERDFWKDVVRKPDVVTNMGGSNAAWSALTRNASRTDWGSWNTKWSGWFRRTSRRVGVQTTVQTKLERKSLGDSIVDQSVIPIMRSVPGGIRFRGLSLKPNTIVYPFFDEENIIDYIRPGIIITCDKTANIDTYNSSNVYSSTVLVNGESATLTHKSKNLKNVFFHITPSSRTSSLYDLDFDDSPTIIIAGDTITYTAIIQQKISTSFRLKTDGLGAVSGIFDVPEGTFKTGTRNFVITDSSTGDLGTSKTSAERDFEASGLKQTVQENIVTTRNPVIRRRRVSQTFRWKDPLAETFLVDGIAYPEGLFVHSVDLWITSRDSSIPITVQIRPVNNGYPDSQKIIPFAEVHLDPDEVTVANTPGNDNYTRFTFSTPVFLQPGEYAFVIMANSVNYEVYTALMGEPALDARTGLPSSRLVNKQPFAGVMFKSQNASTWSAYQEEDIMFRLNRANFQTGTHTAILNAVMDKNQLAAIAPYKKSDIHFNYDASGTGSKFSYNLYRINVPQIRDFDNIIDPSYQYKPRILTESNGTVDDGSFRDTEINETFSSSETFIMEDTDAQPNSFQVKVTFGTNSNIVAPYIDSEQMNVIYIQNMVDELELDLETDLTIVSPGSGYIDGDTLSILDVTTSGELGQISVTTTSGEITGLSYVSGQEAKYVTGGVDVVTLTSSTGDGVSIKAQSETDAFGGPADAKYISRRLSLKSGFESEDIKVTLSAYRPEGTAMYVYYKVKAAEDTDLFENKPWNLMYELSNPNDYSVETTDYLPLEFVTYKTLSDGSIDSTTKGGTFYEYNGTVYDTFNMYAIKVVMTSDVTYRTPVITNLGALALITPIEPAE